MDTFLSPSGPNFPLPITPVRHLRECNLLLTCKAKLSDSQFLGHLLLCLAVVQIALTGVIDAIDCHTLQGAVVSWAVSTLESLTLASGRLRLMICMCVRMKCLCGV